MKVLIGAKTHFSLGESICNPEHLVKDVAKAGWEGLVVSDVHSIDAMPILSQKADGVDIGLAVQVYVVDDLNWVAAKRGEPRKAPNPFFMPTLMANNEEGFKDIIGLLTLANREDHRCKKPARPQLSLDEVLEVFKRGNIGMTLGSAYSVFSMKDAYDKCKKIADACSDVAACVELVPVNSLYYDRHNAKACEAIGRWGFGSIITRPTLNSKGEVAFRNTMNCILDHQKVTDTFRREPAEDLHVLTPGEMRYEINQTIERLTKFGYAESDLKVVFDRAEDATDQYFICTTYKWDKMPVSLPQMAPNPLAALVEQCRKGWSKRLTKEVFGYKPDASQIPVYRDRLKYELGVLNRMGFEDYFLLVSYIVDWSKSNEITVGPGRGSVGGSLVAYLMGITDVDPIRFGLIFERFLNPERIDLPDIDLDFMSSRRQDVVEHLVEHFGEDRVACIANYNTIAGAGAIRETGKAHGLSESDYDCSKLVPKEAGQPIPIEEAVAMVPELESFAIANPTVWKTAVGLQGCFRNFAQHAAGVIVAGEPVANRAVLKNDKGMNVVNWDKRVVEDFGLIKLDVLGLSNLDVMRLAKSYIKEQTGVEVDFTTLRLDDRKVLDSFAAGKTFGVFQFESGGMRRLLKDLGSEGNLTFDDLTAATALYRPGPMQSGLMDQYVKIKRGFESPEYIHPSVEPALRETYSVIVYQEQVMQVARDLAGYSMAEADGLRKIMGKKDPIKMAEQRDKFVDGCESVSGLDRLVATNLFEQIEKFAGYAFNKSHATAYTLISYITMWVKTYHPEAFFAACMSILAEDRLQGLAKDALEHEINIVPPSINKSSDRYEIGYDHRRGQKVLYAPFQAIKGLSETGAQAILEARKGGPFKDKADFIARVNRRSCNVRVQESLDKVGAFAEIEPTQPDARHPDRLRDQKELLPGIVTNNVKAERVIMVDPYVAGELVKIVDETCACSACPLGGLTHPNPSLGKKPRMMLITDMPTWKEEEKGMFGVGDTAGYIKEAMDKHGFKMKDVYMTSLIKARKPKEMELENSMINGCAGYLRREIELLKPPVIVALGTKTIRHLVPEVKGGWEELVGKSHYDPKMDCTIVFGLNPAQIAFDGSKQGLLDAVFAQVAEIFT
jgi:DNA polymerase-3 subunit alpha